MNLKRTEIRIAGLGGQGVVLAGQVLGRAAVYDGKNAVETQSYGAEARGSLAKSEIIISDQRINFPAVIECDILVAMTQQALDRYLLELKKNGMLIVDSTYLEKETMIKQAFLKVRATENAEKTLGTKVYANMVMLGALNAATEIVSDRGMEQAIEDNLSEKFTDANKRAYRLGKQLAH